MHQGHISQIKHKNINKNKLKIMNITLCETMQKQTIHKDSNL